MYFFHIFLQIHNLLMTAFFKARSSGKPLCATAVISGDPRLIRRVNNSARVFFSALIPLVKLFSWPGPGRVGMTRSGVCPTLCRAGVTGNVRRNSRITKLTGAGIFAVLTLLSSSLHGQQNSALLDSILESPQDTHQVLRLIELTDSLITNREAVPELVFERAIELGNELKYNHGLMKVHTSRYIYYLNTGNTAGGLVTVEKAIEYARICDKDYLEDWAYLSKVNFLMMAGQTREAAELAASLARKFHEDENLNMELRAYGLLSMLYSGVGNVALTVLYDSTAVARARSSNDDLLLCKTLLIVSGNNGLLSMPEEALATAEEALAIARKNDFKTEIRNALSMRAEASIAMGQYTAAIEDYDFLKVGEMGQKSPWRMINKGIALQRVGRHDEAREILLEAIQINKSNSNDPLELKRAYNALQTVGLDQKEYDIVTRYGKLMAAQQDSLQIAENTKSLLELEEKYKAEEKETEIRFQQEQLKFQRNLLYITIFVLLLALVAGMLLFLLREKLKKRNAHNEELVAEKDVLIGEIHHRVKNNLQVISSLLQLQRSGLHSDNGKGREALMESQSRVSAMGLIHKKLYQGEEVTTVNMQEYLRDLGETLLDAYRLENQVDIFYDVLDIELDVDIAIPLGLIINELITNSLKYAFPRDREGTIEIVLHKDNDRLKLVVSDDGVGPAAAEKRTDSTSFGTNLIGLLTKKLKGDLQRLEGKGYGVKILFSA